MVVVSADDPGMHSSQNEQDNRYYAKFAKVPLLEPTDPQEAKDFVATGLRDLGAVRGTGPAAHDDAHLARQGRGGAG